MCNCLYCLTNNISDSPPAKSQEMHLVKSQWSHQNLGLTKKDMQFTAPVEELPGQHMATKSEEVKDVLPSIKPASIKHSVLPFNEVRPGRSGDNFIEVRADEADEDSVIEMKNNHMSSSTMDYHNNVLLANNPFNPQYELWEVIADRVRVRISEHRKSKKICELSPGTVVRCIARASGGKRFKIDLPLIGWCPFKHFTRVGENRRGKTQEAYSFKRVEPSNLAILDSRFVLELKLGQGSFGKVYVAWDSQENRKVAIKIDQPKGDKPSVFGREIEIMKIVKDCKSVPRLQCFGSIMSHTKAGEEVIEENSYVDLQYMVLDLQGMSLSVLQKNYLKFFTLKTVMMLGIEIVQLLRSVHEKGILHRDIKPANFVISRGDKGRGIYILDFGLSVMYRKDDGSHVRYRKGCRRCGTARYSSVNTHNRIRQSRRDDLEAVGYVLLLFLRNLPWKQKKGEAPEKKWKRILHEKLRWTPKELCIGLHPLVGDVFCKYFHYCRHLKYPEEPDYEYLIKLFTDTLHQNNEVIDFMYDWVTIL